MVNSLIKLVKRIQLKYNKLKFLSNSNVKVGNNFKLGDYTTTIIHPYSKISIGNQVDIRNFFNVTAGKNAELKVEDKVFFNNCCSINVLEKVIIGKNTLFGENVRIYDHNHKYDSHQVYHQEFNTSPICIGENCWIGSNVVILKGVTIGDNVIIGAGCVIHKDVPSNSIIINKQEHIVKSI